MDVDTEFVAAQRTARSPVLSNKMDFDRLLAIVAAVSAVLIAGVSIAGWVLDIEILEPIWPHGMQLEPNAAFGLTASALSLILAVLVPRARVTQAALGAAVAAFGLLVLLEYALGADFGLDNLLVHDASSYLTGRPAVPTAASFIALGLALTLVNTRSAPLHILRAGLAVGVIVFAFTGILGYFISPIDPAVQRTSFALGVHTAVAFLLLGLGVLAPNRSSNKVSEFVSVAAPFLALAAMGSLVVMTLVAVDSQRHVRERGRDAETAAQSLGRLLDLLQDAETGQRGYLLTGMDEDLQPYASAAPMAASEIARIAALVGNDAEGQTRLKTIRSLAEGELDELRRTIDLKRSGDEAAALTPARRGDGKRMMDQLRREIAKMQAGSLRRADGLDDEADRILTWLQYMTMIAVSVVVALAAFLLLDGRRRLAEMRRAQQRLTAANEDLDRKVTQKTRDLSAALDAARSALGSREQAEEALRKSEHRLRLLIEASSNAIYRMNIDWKKMWRLSGADFLADVKRVDDGWLERFIPDDDRERVVSAIQTAIRTKSVFQLEHRVLQGNGRVGWAFSRAVPMLDDDGEIVEWFGAATDITARKQAEEALQASEEQLRFALVSARAGAWRRNVASGQLIWSPEMFALHGLDPSSAGSSYTEWLASVHPKDRAKATRDVNEAFENRVQDFRMEYRVPVSPSAERWLLAVGRIEYAADGPPIAMSGISLDITKQKRAETAALASEAALRQSQTQLRHAADAARLTYADIDLATGRLSVAENFASVMGYTPRIQAGGRSFADAIADLVRAEDAAASSKAIDAVQALLAGAPEAKLEQRIVGDDGVARWIESVWSLENGPDQQPARVLLTNLDVTTLVEGREALAEAKAQAERANLAKSKFLASASHDLRQPVQSLLLLMALVETQVKGNAKPAHTVEMMKNALGGLNGLLTAILDLSRLDAGAIEPAMEIVPLGSMLDRLANEHVPKASAQRLKLRVVKRDFCVSTDPALFERALRNLIENALRYTPKGGVLIGMRRRGGAVRIDVIDTGIGIPVDKQTEIFEEFHQLHNPGRDLRQGLGLGLAIVARVASLLGARIEVSSRPGRGSRFSLTLPLSLDPAAPAVEAEGEPAEARGSILIIEDNDILRRSLEEMVSDWGYAALTAQSGEEALNLSALGSRFDAIVTDYRLGAGLNGIEAALEIEREAGRVLPKLVLTADTAKERLTEIRDNGFRHLFKPVATDVLRRKLADMLATG